MAKQEKAVLVLFIIGAIFGIIASILTIIQFFSDNTNVWNSGVVLIGLAISGIVGLMALNVIGAIMIFRAFDILFTLAKRTKFTVKILEESKLQKGGKLVLEIKLKGYLTRGHLRTYLKTPYGDRETFLDRYNEDDELGNIHGNFNEDRPLKSKCIIPESFEHGDAEAIIELINTVPILFSLKIKHIVYHQKITFSISDKKDETLEIQKIIKPLAKELSSGICIKTYNNSSKSLKGCFGTIKTNNIEVPLYDYQEFLKSDKKSGLDGYSVFSIDSNSTKLLYAEIDQNIKPLTVSIDIGKQEIKREFTD